MAIAYDTISTQAFTGGSPSLTHTGTGSQLCAVVLVGLQANPWNSTASATYGGVSMTLVEVRGGQEKVHILVLFGAAAGAQTVSVTLDGANIKGNLICMTFTGVGSAYRDNDGSTGTGNSVHLSETLTTLAGDMCVDVFNETENAACAPDSGQTETFDMWDTTVRTAGSYKLASGSTTAMGYTGGGAFQSAEHASIALQPPVEKAPGARIFPVPHHITKGAPHEPAPPFGWIKRQGILVPA